MKFNLKRFVSRYQIILSIDQLGDLLNAIAEGHTSCEVSEYEYERMERLLQEHNAKVKEYDAIGKLRLKGMEWEKTSPKKAMQYYKKCIEMGEASIHDPFSAFAHAYVRLIVLLNKEKKYDEQAQYIKAYLQHKGVTDAEREKYNKRLEKITKKYEQR